MLFNALAGKRALVGIPLPLWTAAVTPRSLWLDGVEALEHLGVVGAHDPPKVRHGGIADLDGPAVEDLVQLVAWRETGVDNSQELSPDVGGDIYIYIYIYI